MTDAPDQPAPAPKPLRKRASYAVMALMGLNILLGIGVAVAGHWLLESDGMALAGGVLATLAAVVMLSFQLWGDKS